MPSNKGLSLFLQKDPVTEEQLYKLLESRREVMKPFLERITMQSLNQHTFVYNGRGYEEFKDNKGEYLGNCIYHAQGEVQGIFHHSYKSCKEVEIDRWVNEERVKSMAGETQYWGLSRYGDWLIVHGHLYRDDNPKAEFLHNVWIKHAESAKDMCEQTQTDPRVVLEHLRRAAEDWVESKRQQLKLFGQLLQMMEAEERVLEVLKKT